MKRPLDSIEAFRVARADRTDAERAATVSLEEPQPTPIEGPAWSVLEELYLRCARHCTLADIRDLERIRIRRDALANGEVITDEAVELAMQDTRRQKTGVRPLADEAERETVRARLARARAGYRSRVRAAFLESIPEPEVLGAWERELLDGIRSASRPVQLRALVLLTVLAHMYVNTAVYSDTSDEKEAPPSVLMRVWKAVARITKSAAPYQPVGSIYEIAELNVRRVEHDGGPYPAFLDSLTEILRQSVAQRSLTQDAVERVDLLFPFIQRETAEGWVSDRLERTTWNLIFLMSMAGDHGVRPVLDWLASHGASLASWWRTQSRAEVSGHPLFRPEVRAELDRALEEAATWSRVMGSLFTLLGPRNDHTPAQWFRFVRHWPDWNIETEEQDELVAGFNGGQLQALHALDDLFLPRRGSQMAVEMQYQERYLSDADYRQLDTLQTLMEALRTPWRHFVGLSDETTGRFNSVVWEILSFRVSHTSKAWTVLKEGENPSTGGMFEDEDAKTERAVDERSDALGPDSPQHLHFVNAALPRLLETCAGLIREDSVAGRYWHWSVNLRENGESATDPHRRLQALARAVWTQRRALEEQRSTFQLERAASSAHDDAPDRGSMGADEWLEHLRRYDPRWSGAIGKGQTLLPSATLERALLLRRVEMFSTLEEVVLAEIAPWMDEHTLAEGETLFEEGDEGDVMYIVAEGCLRIVRGGRPLVERGAMEIVGELAVLDPAPRSASAVALEPTRLLSLRDEHLYTLISDYPEIARGVIRVLCRRLR